jgi:hypothetical protein
MTTPSKQLNDDFTPGSRTDHADAASAADAGQIRLGCLHCDRDDFDGVNELPQDWTHVAPVQRWELAIRPVEAKSGDGRSIFDWQTHLGICPDCQAEYDAVEKPVNGPPASGDGTQDDESEVREHFSVHPIIRQIIDRDCHVGESEKNVVRHVISKLRDGYDTFRNLSLAERRQFIEQCLCRHRANRREYVEVMSGFTRTLGKEHAVQGSMTGQEVVVLMRQHKKTISVLAFRLGTSQKRVRQVRTHGLSDPLAVRDWIEAITGTDPGPIPERYRINGKGEETECAFCGYPLFHNDEAYEYVSDVFCSISCCRKSRNW